MNKRKPVLRYRKVRLSKRKPIAYDINHIISASNYRMNKRKTGVSLRKIRISSVDYRINLRKVRRSKSKVRAGDR